MANKILAALGISPFSKFLVVSSLSLGLVSFDQLVGSLSEVPKTLAEMGPVYAVLDLVIIALIMYGVYLLYNRQKRGALIAIVTNVVAVGAWMLLVGPSDPMFSAVWGVIYLAVFTVIVAGPVLLFPNEYS